MKKIYMRKLFHAVGFGQEPGPSTYDAFQADLGGKGAEVRGILKHLKNAKDEKREMSPNEYGQLSSILSEILSQESCEKFFKRCKVTPFPFENLHASLIWEDDWPEEENLHKLSRYRMAAFIDCFPRHRGRLNWKQLDTEDMQTVENLQENFLEHEDDGADFIRHLVERADLADVPIETKKLTLKDEHTLRYLVREKRLSGKELAEALSKDGFDGFRNRDPYTVFQKNPDSFRARISKMKKEIG